MRLKEGDRVKLLTPETWATEAFGITIEQNNFYQSVTLEPGHLGTICEQKGKLFGEHYYYVLWDGYNRAVLNSEITIAPYGALDVIKKRLSKNSQDI